MARIIRDAPVCLFCSGPSRFLSKFNKLTVRITLGHTLNKSTPVVLLVCMKSYQRSSSVKPSLRKADAKVVLLSVPTKQISKYFSEYFVNKYNSLNMTTTRDKTKVRPHGSHLYHYARTRGMFITLQRELQRREPPQREPQQQEQQPSQQPACVNDGS